MNIYYLNTFFRYDYSSFFAAVNENKTHLFLLQFQILSVYSYIVETYSKYVFDIIVKSPYYFNPVNVSGFTLYPLLSYSQYIINFKPKNIYNKNDFIVIYTFTNDIKPYFLNNQFYIYGGNNMLLCCGYIDHSQTKSINKLSGYSAYIFNPIN